MPEDEYEAKLADYEAKLAEYDAKADKLEEMERALVAESNEDEASRRRLVARYDAALEAKDEAGIAAYHVEVEALHDRHIKRHAALTALRVEYDALKRPRRPRRTWGQLLGFKKFVCNAP